MRLSEADVRSYVEQHAAILRLNLHLSDWTIDYQYGSAGDSKFAGIGFKGSCACVWEAKRAIITIDPDQHETYADLAETLVHEHLHVHHGASELVRNQAIHLANMTNPRREGELAAFEEVCKFAAETWVAASMNMLKSLGFSWTDLLESFAPWSFEINGAIDHEAEQRFHQTDRRDDPNKPTPTAEEMPSAEDRTTPPAV